MKTIEVPRVLDGSDEGRTVSVVAVAEGSAASPPPPIPKGKTLSEKAYSNGWNAFLRESPLWANPHKPHTGLHFMWYVGWNECRDSWKARRRLARRPNTELSSGPKSNGNEN